MKMHLKSKKERRKRKKVVWFIIFFIIIIIFVDITKKLSYLLYNYATAATKQIVTIAINNATSNDVLKHLKDATMYNISKNKDDEIMAIDYDSFIINTFLRMVTNNIQSDLLAIENGSFSSLPRRYQTRKQNVSFSFPLGSIFSFPLIHELGPEIPVRLEFISAVMTNIKTTIKEYGINNALIEMSIHLQVETKIVLPFFAKNIVVENEIPVSYKIISGKIPSYYGESGITKNSGIFSIPLEN